MTKALKLKQGIEGLNFHKCNEGLELRITLPEDGWERLIAVKRGKDFVWVHSAYRG